MYKKTKLSLLISSALLAQSAFSMQAMAAEEAEVATQETAVEAKESASDMERITVTTRSMEETIEKIPLAISVVNNDMIERNGISSTEDVSKYVAGLTFDVGLAPNDTRPQIRGLSTERGRPNVAILVDGIDISSESLTIAGGGATANMRLMDLQQVEVVKGPQSVNYGRSAFAGAINYVTKKPSFDFGAKVDINTDEHGTQEAAVRIEGGLTDKLSASVKIASWSTDGYYDNPLNGDELGDGESTGAALGLYYVADDWTAYLRAEYSDDEYGQRPIGVKRSLEFGGGGVLGTGVIGESGELLPYAEGTDCSTAVPYGDAIIPYIPPMFLPPPAQVPGADAACRPMITGELTGDESDIQLSNDLLTGKPFVGTTIESTRVSLILDFDLSENITLTSSSSYNSNDTYVQEDFDLADPSTDPLFSMPPALTPFGMQADSNTGYDVEQISQEFKLVGGDEKLSWVASALYWEESMDASFGSRWWVSPGVSQEFFQPIFGAQEFNYAPQQDADATPLTRDTEHVSIAALVKYAITDDMHVTIEGRYIDETIDYAGQNDFRGFHQAFGMDFQPYADMGLIPAESYYTTNSVSSSEFVPRVSVDYQVNETVFTYASAAKGFKPGGVDTTDGDGDVSSGEYKPEELWAYEIGAKAFSEENNAMISIAAFYWDYTNQQTPYTFFDEEMLVTQTKVVNAGETEVKGIELESAWLITDNLTWNMGYVYSDASYTDFNVSDFGDTGVASTIDKMLTGNDEGDYSGKQLPMSAKHSATMNIRYAQEIGKLTMSAEMFGKYSSKRYVDKGNHGYLPSYDVWDVNLGIAGDNWNVIAYVNNVFDDDTIKSALGNVSYSLLGADNSVPWMTAYTLPQPRTAGIRASYQF